MTPAIEKALATLVPSALELVPVLVSALASGRRRAAQDAAEELMQRQAFEAAQRAKRDGRGRPVGASPAKVKAKPARVRKPRAEPDTPATDTSEDV